MKRISFCIWSFMIFLCFISCNDRNANVMDIAPVSNITYDAGNGSILFKWDNPDIKSLAYVEISFKDKVGILHRVLTKGGLSQQLINGFGDSDPYEFKFLAYNTDGKSSEPVMLMAAPREPLLNIFYTTLKVTARLGGVDVNWENNYDTEFYIKVEYTDMNGNYNFTEILAPQKAEGHQFISIGSSITGTQTLDVYTSVFDIYGNQSRNSVLKYHKLEAGKLDRTKWSVADYSSQISATYGPATVLDGLTNTYWHSEWGSGTRTFPHYITFDLGSKKRIEQAEFQHRQDKIMANEIELWGNNKSGTAAASEWKYIGCVVMPQESSKAATLTLQKVTLPNAVEYRYVKLVFTTPSVLDPLNAALAEFALYGSDATN